MIHEIIYSEEKMEELKSDIIEYLNQQDDIDCYEEDFEILESIGNTLTDFFTLIYTGAFHDAIGEIEDVYDNGIVIVTDEY